MCFSGAEVLGPRSRVGCLTDRGSAFALAWGQGREFHESGMIVQYLLHVLPGSCVAIGGSRWDTTLDSNQSIALSGAQQVRRYLLRFRARRILRAR